MNKDIMGQIFPGELSYILAKRCPFCQKKVSNLDYFKDDISLREFEISGLCQDCQDKVFSNEDEE